MSHLNSSPRMLTWAAIGAAALMAAALVPATSARAASVPLPPTHAGFDYQIGGAYSPPAAVGTCARHADGRVVLSLCPVRGCRGHRPEPDA